MKLNRRIFIFLGLFLALILIPCFLTSYYFFIAFDLEKPALFLTGLTLFFWALLYLLGEVLGKFGSRYLIKWIGAMGLGVISIGVPITVFGFLSLALPVSRVYMGVVLLISWIGSVILSSFFASRLPKLTTFDINLNLARPLSMVQITDVHLNGFTSYKKIERWVAQINKLSPDIIVFTGDLADIPINQLEEECAALRQLKAKYAKLAISGNHDFYTTTFDFPTLLNQIGFDYIDNDCRIVQDICFAGLPDQDGKRHGVTRKPIMSILPKLNKDIPIILLDHRPEYFEKNVDEANINLQLSGHTHWGQLPPFGLLVRLRYKYGMGLKPYKKAIIYTSKGTSVWGPPMRFQGRSEIVLFQLT